MILEEEIKDAEMSSSVSSPDETLRKETNWFVKEKYKDAKMSSFSSDFQMLIKH